MKTEIKAFIFDMDGVILDSETICDKTWEIAFKESGITDENDLINKCRGTNRHDTIEILKKYYPESFDAVKFLNRTSDLFHEIEFAEGIPLMPFAKEILEYLKNRNYRIALASSTRKEAVYRQLKNTNVFDYFETITTGDMVLHSKPNPEIYQIACKSLGLIPEDCAAIEDSPNGIRSAFNAGMKAIMVPDKIQPTEEISKLTYHIFKNLQEMKSFF